jgi:hypothetical protein
MDNVCEPKRYRNNQYWKAKSIAKSALLMLAKIKPEIANEKKIGSWMT